MTKDNQDKKIDMGYSVFKMEDVKHILTITNLIEAKKYALDILEKSTANAGNKKKIKAMIIGAKSIDKLSFTMTNCLLAHPAEGLKVL